MCAGLTLFVSFHNKNLGEVAQSWRGRPGFVIPSLAALQSGKPHFPLGENKGMCDMCWKRKQNVFCETTLKHFDEVFEVPEWLWV